MGCKFLKRSPDPDHGPSREDFSSAGYDNSFSRFSRTPTRDRHAQTDTDTGPWLIPRMHSIAR